MELENRVLKLDPGIDNEHLGELISQLKDVVDDIDEIVLEDKVVVSSAVFSLIKSLKKTNENIKVPFFEKDKDSFIGIGNVTFVN